MASSERLEQFSTLTELMYNLYEKKDTDYGDSFGKLVAELGPTAALVRLGDKYNRLKTLFSGQQPLVQESAEDTLLDLACYSLMTIIILPEIDKFLNKTAE